MMLTGLTLRRFKTISRYQSVSEFYWRCLCYIFDKEIIIKALEEPQISGEEYLDKLVQIYFELPIPDKTLIRRLLLKGSAPYLMIHRSSYSIKPTGAMFTFKE
jgi:hypothetical protein